MTDVKSDAASRPGPILIADDHNLVRDGLKLLVTGIVGFADFLEAHDAETLLAHARSSPPPSIALVDLNMPGMERGSRLAELSWRHPDLPIVVISALTSPDIVRRALEIASVYAFVPKSATAEHMREAIHAAQRRAKLPYGEKIIPGDVQSELLLSPRLEEVRALLRLGMSNKLIASQLGISEGTVKNYMSDIFKALKVTNRTQAARFDADAA